MDKNTIKLMISRILERAFEAREECKKDLGEGFEQGRRIAYYEILDIIKSELYVGGELLSEYGLDINLEKELL